MWVARALGGRPCSDSSGRDGLATRMLTHAATLRTLIADACHCPHISLIVHETPVGHTTLLRAQTSDLILHIRA